ncbi:MAG: ATP-dependent DNA ligase [Clostridia bacterium]|nr:ATP-dependent DNA ligase [Clostridia bacterium]
MNYFESEPMKYFAPAASMNAEMRRLKLESMATSGQYLYGLKTDGNWSRAIITPERSALQTRGISKKTGTYGEIQSKVFFWESIVNAFKDTTVILGEVFLPGKIDRDIGSILRCLDDKALARQKTEKLRWRIFDVLCYEGEDLMNTGFEKRISYIPTVVQKINDPLVEGVNYYEMTDTFFEEMEDIFSKGGEGAVCYKKDSIYIPGKRGPHAWDTCKVKQEISSDIDCLITNLIPCERTYHGDNIGNWELWENTRTGELVKGLYFGEYQNGKPYIPVSKNYWNKWPGAIEVSVYNNEGKLVPLCNVAGLTDDMKESMSKNFDEWYLCPVTIGGMMLSNTGTDSWSVRHPYLKSIRKGDIDPKDCTLSKILG